MKKKIVLIIVACAVVLAAALTIRLCGGKQVTEEPVVEPTVVPGVAIEMAHDTMLYVADEYAANLVHEQETNGAVKTDVFYMQMGETKTGIYRFDFGSEEAGDWLGILKTDVGDIPVTYTVFLIPEEEMAAMGKGASEIYYALMNSFNDAMNSIYEDSRFIAEKELDLGVDQEVKMTYWTVTLPGSMSWTETTEEGNYHATFYGEIKGEQVVLYTVCIGETETGTDLGLFELDGVDKPVSVESFDLYDHADWTEEDYSAAYRMMDTINDVINQIMSSEQYSVPMPSEAPPAAAENG